MNLLKQAIEARVPLIAARSDDPGRFIEIVCYLLPKQAKKIQLIEWRNFAGKTNKLSTIFSPGHIGVMLQEEETNWYDTLRYAKENDCVVIMVNPKEIHPTMMDVGYVTVPHSMVEEFVDGLIPHTGPAGFRMQLISSLSGLSLSNMDRIAAMAMNQFQAFSPHAVRTIRRQFFPTQRGLEEVQTEQRYYWPPKRLKGWMSLEGQLFLHGQQKHRILMPRGLLFTGRTGTGKTSGAKWIAAQMEVPLYRLDMGMVLSKWAGESDSRLNAALEQIETFEPCVLLMDEVEKLFEISDASGIMQRLLSYLLWWLQERQSKVLVIMTTNDESKIPPELYRPGRIDEAMVFQGVDKTSGEFYDFIRGLIKSLKDIGVKFSKPEVTTIVQDVMMSTTDAFIPQATIIEHVLKLVKVKVLNQLVKGASYGKSKEEDGQKEASEQEEGGISPEVSGGIEVTSS